MISPGDLIEGRYEVRALVGEGGMARVHLCWDRLCGCRVAIKSLRPECLTGEDVVEELKRETRTGRSLSHPNIVGIYEFQYSRNEPLILMEFIEGVSMDRYLARQRRQRLAPDRFSFFMNQILSAVAYAHNRTVLHLDLKPANFMVQPDDQVKITDFGIAVALREVRAGERGRASGLTLQYSSPEQIQGRSPTAHMDIYSLGCVMYHLLVGAPPFPDGDVRKRQLEERPRPLEGTNQALSRLVLKCLEKNPDRRIGTVTELIDELRACSTGGNRPQSPPSGVSLSERLQSMLNGILQRSAQPAADWRTPPMRWPGQLWVSGQAPATEVIDLVDRRGRGRIELGRQCADTMGEVRIADATLTMSRVHAAVYYNPSTGQFALENLTESSRTRLNGRMVPARRLCPLKDGDLIEMGKVKAHFRHLPDRTRGGS